MARNVKSYFMLGVKTSTASTTKGVIMTVVRSVSFASVAGGVFLSLCLHLCHCYYTYPDLGCWEDGCRRRSILLDFVTSQVSFISSFLPFMFIALLLSLITVY